MNNDNGILAGVVIVALLLMATGLFVKIHNYTECRDKSFSVLYCVTH